MTECLVLKRIVQLFLVIHMEYWCAILGGKSGWYLKKNEHHYVYDMFGHGKVIAQPQALI
jgi:hypothetical protein